MLSSEEIVAELNRLGVRYVRGHSGSVPAEPADLLAGLASSSEARLRSAIIPLLLLRPSFATAALAAVERLEPTAQTVLRCFYTAAVLLQSQHARRLSGLQIENLPLPDYFSNTLGIELTGQRSEDLAALASRQATLSGDAINWLGTYQHAASSSLSRQERASRWTPSTPRPSLSF